MRLFLLSAFFLEFVAATSCGQIANNEFNQKNLDSIVLVQVDHPYLCKRVMSQRLNTKFLTDFLSDFADKKEDVLKFYSCYVIKLYYINGHLISYRTNGRLFEKLKDDSTKATYFKLNKDINLVTKYWGIPREKFCEIP